ncbi:MAG: FixH family protein [Reichenbachiella sp.]|uniref:FixH family protein n=1 Tax=Reichenbachiella sp. TaxID=2184521 RepID=UPI003262F5E8
MNWGKSIVVAFVLFAGLIITMVVISMKHDVNLVDPNYYEEELAYQDQIDRIQNYQDLALKPEIVKTTDQIILIFPSELADLMNSGEIHFFRPSDHAVDQRMKIKLDNENKQAFSISGFGRGLWKTKLRWTAGDKEYFSEQRIVL